MHIFTNIPSWNYPLHPRIVPTLISEIGLRCAAITSFTQLSTKPLVFVQDHLTGWVPPPANFLSPSHLKFKRREVRGDDAPAAAWGGSVAADATAAPVPAM